MGEAGGAPTENCRRQQFLMLSKGGLQHALTGPSAVFKNDFRLIYICLFLFVYIYLLAYLLAYLVKPFRRPAQRSAAAARLHLKMRLDSAQRVRGFG